ncbi:hypothetical protein ES703_39730 [subsurface metagenome]
MKINLCPIMPHRSLHASGDQVGQGFRIGTEWVSSFLIGYHQLNHPVQGDLITEPLGNHIPGSPATLVNDARVT